MGAFCAQVLFFFFSLPFFLSQSLSRDQIGLFLLCGTPLVAFRRIVGGKKLVQSLGSLQASKAHHCKSVRPVTGGFLASKNTLLQRPNFFLTPFQIRSSLCKTPLAPSRVCWKSSPCSRADCGRGCSCPVVRHGSAKHAALRSDPNRPVCRVVLDSFTGITRAACRLIVNVCRMACTVPWGSPRLPVYSEWHSPVSVCRIARHSCEGIIQAAIAI